MRLRIAKAFAASLVLGLSSAAAGPLPAAQAVSTPPQPALRQPDVIYVPTRASVVDAKIGRAHV